MTVGRKQGHCILYPVQQQIRAMITGSVFSQELQAIGSGTFDEKPMDAEATVNGIQYAPLRDAVRIASKDRLTF